MTFQIVLRDISSEPCTFAVEEKVQDDFAGETEEIREAIKRFVVQAYQKTFPHNDVDVYIGWWLDQGCIEFPPEFFNLIAEKKWKVTLDIND